MNDLERIPLRPGDSSPIAPVGGGRPRRRTAPAPHPYDGSCTRRSAACGIRFCAPNRSAGIRPAAAETKHSHPQ